MRKFDSPPQVSSTDNNYDRCISPTATDLPVSATALSMIAEQNIIWETLIYNSDDNLNLKFSPNFISLMYLGIYLIKLVFDYLNLFSFQIKNNYGLTF